MNRYKFHFVFCDLYIYVGGYGICIVNDTATTSVQYLDSFISIYFWYTRWDIIGTDTTLFVSFNFSFITLFFGSIVISNSIHIVTTLTTRSIFSFWDTKVGI